MDPEGSLNGMDDISRFMFQRYGKADTEVISGRDEKRAPVPGSEEEFTVPQKQDYPHPLEARISSQNRPHGKSFQVH